MKTSLQFLKASKQCLTILFIFFLASFSERGFGQKTQTFTANGNFVVPAGVTTVNVEAWGGGGAGGGVLGANSTNKAGGGGSGGTYTKAMSIGVTPGATIAVSVGAGGLGVSAADGGAGGTSVFASGIPVSAVGGGGGKAASATNQFGLGGGISTGITFNGGSGATGTSAVSGAGGGGAGSAGSGADATGGTAGIGGVGGGGSGAAGVSTSIGGNGLFLGGGGSGGHSSQGTNRVGGDGFRGQVIVTYACPTYSLTNTSASSVCIGNASTITLTGLPNGSYTVTYNLSAPNFVSVATAAMTVSGGIGTFSTASLANSGSTTISITNLQSGAAGAICSNSISTGNTASIIVNPNVAITTQPAVTQTVCAGSSVSFTVGAIGAGLTYQWKKGGADISGATSSTYTIANPVTADMGTYTVIVSGICGTSVTSGDAVLGVNSSPVITTQPATPAAVCAGTGIRTISVSATGTALTFQWRKNGTNLTNIAPYSGVTTAVLTISNPSFSENGALYDVVVTGACSPAVTSNTTALIVDAVSVGGNTSSAATVCTGANSGIINLTGNTGNVVKWQSSLNGTTWSDISNTTTAQTYTNLTATTQYRAVVQSGVCASANSSATTITVSPVTAGGSMTGSATVCTGSNSTALTLSGHTGTITKWQSSTDNFTTAGTDITNTTTSLIATNLTITTSYRAVIQSGGCPTANSGVATVTVSPASVGGTISSNQTICSGSVPANLVLSGFTGSVTKWQRSESSGFNGGTTQDINNTTSTLTGAEIGALTATTYFKAFVKSGVCGEVNSVNVITITINPPPSIFAISGSNTCQGLSTGTVVLSSSQTGVSYQLVYADGSNEPSQSTQLGSGNSLSWSDIAANTYKIKARLISTGCESFTASYIVASNSAPAPPLITPSNPSICVGSSTSLNANGIYPNVLITELFSNGTAPGWQQSNSSVNNSGLNNINASQNSGGTVDWAILNSPRDYTFGGSLYTFKSPDNSNFIMTNHAAQSTIPYTTTVLYTPAFSTQGMANASIKFSHTLKLNPVGSNAAQPDEAIIEASAGSITGPWIPIRTFKDAAGIQIGATNAFVLDSVSLTGGFLNQNNVYFRFVYKSKFQGWWWAMDDIFISTAPTVNYVWSPATDLYNDAGFVSPYVLGTKTATVYANPKVNTSYLVTTDIKSANGCPANATVTVKVKHVWVGNTSIDWNTPSNWADGVVPNNSCTKVYIKGNRPFQPTLSSGTAVVTDLIIEGGAYLKVNGTGILGIAGTITNAGTLDLLAGTLLLNGTNTPQTIDGKDFKDKTIYRLTINNNVNVVTNDTLKISAALGFDGGASGKIFNAGSNNVTLLSTLNYTANVNEIKGGNSITGTNFTIERYISTGTKHGQSWQLLSTAVTGPNTTILNSWQEGGVGVPIKPGYGTRITSPKPGNGFDGISQRDAMKVYNPTINEYDGVTSTSNALANPKGYYIFVRGDRSVMSASNAPTPTILRSTGTLNTGDLLPSVSVEPGKFITVGNPYPSTIDLVKLYTAHSSFLAPDFYIWDPTLGGSYGVGGFRTLARNGSGYNTTPPGGIYSNITNYIQSGQAFFVRSNGSAGLINFKESYKYDTSRLTSRINTDSNTPFIQTVLSGADAGVAKVMLDGALAIFGDEFKNGVDYDDADKFVNVGVNTGFVRSGKKLAVERMQLPTPADTMHMDFSGAKQLSYTWSINLENFKGAGVDAWLLDKFLKTKSPLKITGNNDIDFTVDNNNASTASDRFKIVFTKAVVAPVKIKGITAVRNNDKTISTSWKVDSENNVTNYILERSADGITFSSLFVKTPLYNNGAKAEYTYEDANPLMTDIYYRIKAMSKDGQIQYSAVVKVDAIKLPSSISVYPNPIVNKELNLSFTNKALGTYNIKITNNIGQVVYNGQVVISSVIANKKILLGEQKNVGIYQLTIKAPDGSIEQKPILVK